METPPTQQVPPQEIATDSAISSSTTNKIGIFALLMIFAASAFITVAYLQNNISHTPRAMTQITQIANAAVSVQTVSITIASSTLQAHTAYVLDITNGHVLYSLNPDAQLPLASITKVAMALAVSEVLSPDAHITIPEDTAPKGSIERLAKGDVWRIGDVIDFTLAASSNGGAEILAAEANDALHARYPQSPATGATLWRMNDLARQLHLTKTYFLNVSGLDESTTQSGAYGSAHDVAQLMAYAASTSPQVFVATTQPSFSLLSINGAKTIAINTDKALDAIPGIIMGKTGYTDLAGGNLAVVFNAKPNHPVVAVVLDSTEQGRFEDMKRLVAAVQAALR